MKIEEKQEARRLRKDLGWPIGRISETLGVAKSSVSLWVRDIDLTEEQKAHLVSLNPIFNNALKGANKRHETGLTRRREEQQIGREDARKNDPLHLAGCMLYWAEGSKCKNTLKFTNSDQDMLCFFLKFLKYYEVQKEDITIYINCYTNNGLTSEQIEDKWLEILDLPRSCLRKTQINQLPRQSQSKKKNKLVLGTCGITVNDTCIVQRVYGAIKEYAGISDDRWIF